MKIEEIIQLIEAVNKNNVDKFSYEKEGEKLHIGKNMPKVIYEGPNKVQEIPVIAGTNVQNQVVSMEKETITDIDSGNVVNSPLVGTFYKAASPDSKPFVEIGTKVKKGQILGIIEAMKLMNEIESDFDGVVEAILVNDGDVVEFGQALFRIR